jgi:hypothetical protein
MPDSGAVDRNHDLAVKVGRPDQRGVAEATPAADSIVSAARQGFATGEKLASGKVPGVDVSPIRKEIAAAQPEEK